MEFVHEHNSDDIIISRGVGKDIRTRERKDGAIFFSSSADPRYPMARNSSIKVKHYAKRVLLSQVACPYSAENFYPSSFRGTCL